MSYTETEPFPELDPFMTVDPELWPELTQTDLIATLASVSSEYVTIQPAQVGKVHSSASFSVSIIPWTMTFVVGLEAFVEWLATSFGWFWTWYGFDSLAWASVLFLAGKHNSSDVLNIDSDRSFNRTVHAGQADAADLEQASSPRYLSSTTNLAGD